MSSCNPFNILEEYSTEESDNEQIQIINKNNDNNVDNNLVNIDENNINTDKNPENESQNIPDSKEKISKNNIEDDTKIVNNYKEVIIKSLNDKKNKLNESIEEQYFLKYFNNKYSYDISDFNSIIKFNMNKPRKNNFNFDYENKKKILCYNILNKGSCTYGPKCLYAHSLEEQKINSKIKIIYDIIKNNNSLENINLIQEKHLYCGFLHLTKLCPMCVKGNCPGGYNCKYGSFSKKFQICKNDLQFGICNNNDCELIHLTKRGLVPYIKCKKKYSSKNNLNNNMKNIIKNNKFQNINSFNQNLLSNKLIDKLEIENNKYDSDVTLTSESDDENNNKYYLSDTSENSLDELIFN